MAELQVSENVWTQIEDRLLDVSGQLGSDFPYVTGEDGKWKCLRADQYGFWDGEAWSHGNWFCGFWPGMLWLAFERSRRERFREEATLWLERMWFRQYDPNSHDIGFLSLPGFVKGFFLTGESRWRNAALTMAHTLAGRFSDRAGIVQAWGRLDDPRARGSSTIDTMMNLPLLWWAARETGDPSFLERATRHARVSASVYVREDGSTFHTARFDSSSGKLLERGTYQGLSGSSCWSRGLAWAIAGFAEAYRQTRDPQLLAAVETVSNYYFEHAPPDLVPYWDYGDPEIPSVPRDSAAAAIASGGFLTMAEIHPQTDERQGYATRARQVLRSLLENYYVGSRTDGYQGLLGQACYSKPHNEGVNSSLIVGDFFFLQNLLRAVYPSSNHVSPFSAPAGEDLSLSARSSRSSPPSNDL